jgi:hypothetical protein
LLTSNDRPKQKTVKRTNNSTSTLTSKSNNYQYSEDFFTLPPYQRTKNVPSNNTDSSLKPGPTSKAGLYSLTFTGELKPGMTLLEVKNILNRRYGIEYRKLIRLIKGYRIVLKHSLSYEKALRWRRIFESSGAICTITAQKELPNKIDNSLRKTMNKNNNAVSRKDFQLPQKKNVKDRDHYESPFQSLAEINNTLDRSVKRLEPTKETDSNAIPLRRIVSIKKKKKKTINYPTSTHLKKIG